jgi:hypothetical protein
MIPEHPQLPYPVNGGNLSRQSAFFILPWAIQRGKLAQ